MFLFLLLNILYFSISSAFANQGCGYKEFRNPVTSKCQDCHSSCKQCNGPLPSNCLECHGTNVKCHTENGIYCKPARFDCSSSTPAATTMTSIINKNEELSAISDFTYLNILLSILLLFCVFLAAIYAIRALKKRKSVDTPKSRINSIIEEPKSREKPLIEPTILTPKSSRSNTQKEEEKESIHTIAELEDENLVIDNLDCKKGTRINSGGFAHVLKCPYTDKDGRYYVAVKIVKETSNNRSTGLGGYSQIAFEEREIMRRAGDHPHIIKLITTKIDDNMQLVMPLRKDNLSHFLEKSPNISKTNKIRYCQQIANGMSYLIFRGIVHCDLKASNILVVSENWIEIGDFGLAKRMDTGDNKRTLGTITHAAVELLAHNNVPNSEATDIWSFGVTIWEIFNETKQHPYADSMKPVNVVNILSYLEAKNHLKQTYWPSSDDCPFLETIATNMYQCWRRDSKRRPTFQKLWHLFSSLLPESPPLLSSQHSNFLHNSKTR